MQTLEATTPGTTDSPTTQATRFVANPVTYTGRLLYDLQIDAAEKGRLLKASHYNGVEMKTTPRTIDYLRGTSEALETYYKTDPADLKSAIENWRSTRNETNYTEDIYRGRSWSTWTANKEAGYWPSTLKWVQATVLKRSTGGDRSKSKSLHQIDMHATVQSVAA